LDTDTFGNGSVLCGRDAYGERVCDGGGWLIHFRLPPRFHTSTSQAWLIRVHKLDGCNLVAPAFGRTAGQQEILKDSNRLGMEATTRIELV
jgi:hypothetical protein